LFERVIATRQRLVVGAERIGPEVGLRAQLFEALDEAERRLTAGPGAHGVCTRIALARFGEAPVRWSTSVGHSAVGSSCLATFSAGPAGVARCLVGLTTACDGNEPNQRQARTPTPDVARKKSHAAHP